jgi:hypothetical protein
MGLYRLTRVPNQELHTPTAWSPTAVAYALCEIATRQLDLAASTLDARHLSNSLSDYSMKLAQSRLALARKDPTQAIAILEPVLENVQQFKIYLYMSEALFLKGQAHLMHGEGDSAKTEFEQVRLAAEALGARWLMRQILAALAGVESDEEKSSALKLQARQVTQFIADHIHEDEMRSQFLQSEGVRLLMA